MRFVVAVLLMTAIPVNAVFAECAWVLWSDETVYVFTGQVKGKAFVPDEHSDITSTLARSSPLRSHIVGIVTAAAKLPECTAIRRARLKQRVDEAKKSGDYDEVLLHDDETGMSTFKWTKLRGAAEPADPGFAEGDPAMKRAVVTVYQCLPDTVDPRKSGQLWPRQ